MIALTPTQRRQLEQMILTLDAMYAKNEKMLSIISTRQNAQSQLRQQH